MNGNSLIGFNFDRSTSVTFFLTGFDVALRAMSAATFQPRDRPWTLAKSRVFLKDDSNAVNIRITDVAKDHYASTLYTSPTRFQEAIDSTSLDKIKIRIISVYSRKTISPLDVTQALLEHVFETYNVHHEFSNVVASFGQDPNIAEGSSNNATIHEETPGDCKLSYQIRYVEQNRRGGQDPWSLRHTGVFHCHSLADGTDIFILLHPIRVPLVETVLTSLEDDLIERKKFCENPFLLHTWLFSQYFDNWRWYFRYIGERFAEENNVAMVVKPERTEPNSSFLRVQRLRNTNDFILFARACCSGNNALLGRLSRSSTRLLSDLGELSAHESKMGGYIESADVLKGRVQNLIDLVGYTLTLHNQLEAAKIDTELRDLTEGLKRLTEDTVDDSATVKIITFVSAIYLPGSFIATLFGMNFFLFNPTSKQLEISPDFWIFLATWLPLIFITVGIYVFILYVDSRLKRKTFRWPWQMRPSGRSVVSLPQKLET
ncbi:Nn.00g101740.m01.CDS01 [Neocucurbitaria sp. VM-36]